jgi:hypothetical protein
VQHRLKSAEFSISPLALQPTPYTMRFSTPVFLLAFAALVAADEASDVISLTAQTFQSTVDAESIMLVEFFAPWYSLITYLNLSISHPTVQVWPLQSFGPSL